jgi:hypothetical protein
MLLRNYRISKVYKTSSESIKKALGGRLLSWKKTLIVLNHRNRYTLRGFNYALFLYTKLKFISFNIINENFGAKIVRADDKTLTISADRIYSASLFASGFNHELEFLLSRSFNTGDIFENKNFKVYISEVKDNLPVKITVETKEALSSDKTAFVRFNPLLNKYEIKNFTPEGLFR